MMTRALGAGIRLAVTAAGVGIGVEVLDEPARDIETTLLMHLVAPFASNSQFIRLAGPHVLVVSHRALPFVAEVTESCSALGAVLAFLAVASVLLRGKLGRRALGFALAAALCIVANLLRIAIALIIGARIGRHEMVTFHDWFGTGIGMISLFGGFILLLRAMLPAVRDLVQPDGSPLSTKPNGTHAVPKDLS